MSATSVESDSDRAIASACGVLGPCRETQRATETVEKPTKCWQILERLAGDDVKWERLKVTRKDRGVLSCDRSQSNGRPDDTDKTMAFYFTLIYRLDRRVTGVASLAPSSSES